jgi:hypothetical protein
MVADCPDNPATAYRIEELETAVACTGALAGKTTAAMLHPSQTLLCGLQAFVNDEADPTQSAAGTS